MKDEFQLTARHESGHFCAFWHEGGRIRSTEIMSNGEGTTITSHPVWKLLSNNSWKHPVMRSWVMCATAGIAAELYFMCKLSCKKIPAFLHGDLEIAWRYMESNGWEPPNSYGYDDFFWDYGKGAKEFAVMWRPQIKLFADELSEKKFISGRDGSKFLESIWPEKLPKGVLRFWEHKK